MFNVSLNRLMRITRLGALAVAALLVCSTAVFAQATGTSTVRGTVTDSSGGVLPGATVTVMNTGTKSVVTAVTDDRGGLSRRLFPGTYDLKVELSGFKTYEQKGIVISPDITRGIDVKLEVGQQSETITVTAQQEVIQTETGAREGVLSAKQIDNLSVIGRSALELLRIMPGVVAPDPINMESVSFGGGANDTQGYTVNGIRGSTNTVSLDGSNLIDIGSNSGVIVTLNNDMVQEVKVQSSNFAAEYGSGAMNVSAVTKAGSSQFHGTLYDYSRSHKFAANDRSNSIAGVEKPESSFQYPGGNIGGPISLRRQLHQEPRQVVLLRWHRSAAPAGRQRRALRRGADGGPAQRGLQRVPDGQRPELRPGHRLLQQRRRRRHQEPVRGSLGVLEQRRLPRSDHPARLPRRGRHGAWREPQ